MTVTVTPRGTGSMRISVEGGGYRKKSLRVEGRVYDVVLSMGWCAKLGCEVEMVYQMWVCWRMDRRRSRRG